MSESSRSPDKRHAQNVIDFLKVYGMVRPGADDDCILCITGAATPLRLGDLRGLVSTPSHARQRCEWCAPEWACFRGEEACHKTPSTTPRSSVGTWPEFDAAFQTARKSGRIEDWMTAAQIAYLVRTAASATLPKEPTEEIIDAMVDGYSPYYIQKEAGKMISAGENMKNVYLALVAHLHRADGTTKP